MSPCLPTSWLLVGRPPHKTGSSMTWRIPAQVLLDSEALLKILGAPGFSGGCRCWTAPSPPLLSTQEALPSGKLQSLCRNVAISCVKVVFFLAILSRMAWLSFMGISKDLPNFPHASHMVRTWFPNGSRYTPSSLISEFLALFIAFACVQEVWGFQQFQSHHYLEWLRTS